MDAGLMMEPVHRRPGDTRPLTALYEEAFSFIEWADSLGCDNIWMGEHHFMEKQWNSSPLLLIAALARRTSHARLGCNILLTPLYEPVRLIEDVATLDIITGGRVDIAFGTGSITSEFETYRIDPEERFGRTFEFLGLIRRAFSEEGPFDHNGKYFQIPHLNITSHPVQKPFPVWYGGHGPKNTARAGRMGIHIAAAFEGPYEEGLREAGGDPDLIQSFAPGNFIVVPRASDVEPMREELLAIEKEVGHEYATTRDLARTFIPPSRSEPTQTMRFVGTPDQVLAHLEPTHKNSRATHIIGGSVANHAMDWASRHRDCVEVYLKEVAPVLRTWGGQPLHKRG